jgi:hypothetical protein
MYNGRSTMNDPLLGQKVQQRRRSSRLRELIEKRDRLGALMQELGIDLPEEPAPKLSEGPKLRSLRKK